MLTRLETDNFRGFRALRADLAPVTAFLGPNSSGKTTALHAIRLGCELLRRAVESELPARVGEHDGRPVVLVAPGMLLNPNEPLLPLLDWRALFVDQNVGAGVRFALTLTYEPADPLQTLSVEVSCVSNGQLRLDVRVESADALAQVAGLAARNPQVSQRLKDYLREHSPLAVFVPPFYGTVREEEARAPVVLDRLLGSGDQSHVVRNLVAALSMPQFERLNAFLQDAVGVRVTRRTSGDALQTEYPLTVYFRDTNGELELSACGAGVVNLIALFASLARSQREGTRRRVVFLLDEPEAHLHPRLQAQNADALARLVTQEFGGQLVLATHSVDILNRLSSQGAQLLRCDRAAEGTGVTPLRSDASLFDDLATWADLTPYTAINFLAARRVLFCEGRGDKAVLERLAQLLYRNDPARLERFRRWSVVLLDGVGNRNVSKLLSRLMHNDLVRAAADHGGFRVVVVLDRDHGRTPGLRSEAQGSEAVGPVHETEVVWSRHSIESLLLDPAVLEPWVRVVAGPSAPADLSAQIARCLAEADVDAALCDAAEEQLLARLLRDAEGDPKATAVQASQKAVHALREAREMVKAAPATWQRGKDRAAKVLGGLRETVALPARNQFPTDIVRLLGRANLDHIGNPTAAVPVEIRDLLTHLTDP